MGSLIFPSFIFLCLQAVSSDKYEILPPVFGIEDYNTCLERNDLYCKATARLKCDNYENNTMWILVNESISDIYRYDRNIIHRGICVPNEEARNSQSTKKFTELHINKELNGTGLNASVEDTICITREIKISSFASWMLLPVVLYLSLIAFATIYDIWKVHCKCKTGTMSDKVVLAFSMKSNWKKVCKIDGNEDFNKLKSIQGIRVYNMLLIIALHTITSSCIVYISNTDDAEKIFSNAVFKHYPIWAFFFIHTFLIISSWIVTMQIYVIYKEHGKFTVRQAIILIVNRFFRFQVSSTVTILALNCSWYKFLRGPITFDHWEIAQKSCTQNWWQTFCLVNNYLGFEDICNPISWYLSMDFQLYIVAIMALYFILKFQLNEWIFLSFLFLFAYILYGSIIYFTEVGTIYAITINDLRLYNFAQSEQYKILYYSTYSGWATSIIGIALGIIYTKNKNRNIVNNNMVYILWLLIFFGLPFVAVFVSEYKLKGFEAAMLVPLIKPLYSLGIGVGILGMSHNIGGIIKITCENKFVLFMSNFSYTTYIFQILVIFSKGIGSYTLMEFGYSQLIKDFLLVDLPGSMIVGIISTLMLEQPGLSIQKMMLPQISRVKQQQKNGL